MERLKSLDPEFTIFGSGSHHYQLNPKLSLDDIENWEKKEGCTLPEEYKAYLTLCGNGGAGPSYGVFALGYMDDGFETQTWPAHIKAGGDFRFTEAYNNDDILDEGMPDEDDFEDEDEYEEAYELWEEEGFDERAERYYEDHSLDGAIPICHHGCASRSWLVVDKKSPQYGRVWEDMTAEDMGVGPGSDDKGNLFTFKTWMLFWVDRSIKDLEEI